MIGKFRTRHGDIPLPIFFPDATRAIVRSLDTLDIKSTKTPGILVNTFHLWRELGSGALKKFGGIANFMSWDGGLISDSGGFQVMSVIKSGRIRGKVSGQGVIYFPSKNKKVVLTPEKSIQFQMDLKTDMVIVLDDFTDPKAGYREAKESVLRTIEWAKRSKKEFLAICEKRNLGQNNRPYILGVVQGGRFQRLRKYCAEELVEIGFDGFGYGGWSIDEKGNFDIVSAKTISESAPKNYFLYGLGVGKPDDIVSCARLGYNIFDCVLPTRDGRHGRLYVYNAKSIKEIDVCKPNFYSFFNAGGQKNLLDDSPVSLACDCLLCKKYSKGYLAHLFKIKDFTAGRLATIHNLRFYSLLMEKIRVALDRT